MLSGMNLVASGDKVAHCNQLNTLNPPVPMTTAVLCKVPVGTYILDGSKLWLTPLSENNKASFILSTVPLVVHDGRSS